MGSGASSDMKIDEARAKEALGEAFDAEAFAAATGEGGTITVEQAKAMYTKVMKSSALIFIKPHANTEATQAFVKGKLEEKGMTIEAEGAISGTDIDEKQLIDNHYYAIASKATLLTPDQLAVPADKFQDFFKEDWATVLSEGRAVNATEACKRLECNSEELEVLWRACEPAGKVVKFGGGFYCGLLEKEGKDPVYSFNCFFTAMRNKFCGADNSIYYYSVVWDPTTLPWVNFRADLIGPTNPANAGPDSLRGHIAANWEALGLKGECTMGDNGVHASASPLEGLSEKMNWLGKAIGDENFGAALQKFGIDDDTIKKWNVDSRVTLADGSEAGIFDSLEDKDVAECMDIALGVYAKQTEAAAATAAPVAEEAAPVAEEAAAEPAAEPAAAAE